MSDTPINCDAVEDTDADLALNAALRNGFQQLVIPSPSAALEVAVKQELTSGRDLSPMHQQILRRLLWTSAPACIALCVTLAVLAAHPVPRISVPNLLRSRYGSTQLPETKIDPQVYAARAPLPDLRLGADDLRTSTGLTVPTWFHKPPAPQKHPAKSGKSKPASVGQSRMPGLVGGKSR